MGSIIVFFAVGGCFKECNEISERETATMARWPGEGISSDLITLSKLKFQCVCMGVGRRKGGSAVIERLQT